MDSDLEDGEVVERPLSASGNPGTPGAGPGGKGIAKKLSFRRSFKGPYLKTLKHVHTEQIARLQAKNQHECDLLEDIRNFTKARSVIEKTYAEALLKVSSAYLNKKIPSIPDLRDEDEEEQWNVWNVWRTVLEENEKLARARLAAVEVFQQQITDDAKTIRQLKLSASKKCLDQLQVVQKELQVSVSDLDRSKKFYFEEEHIAHDARDKARDAEEKLKKKKASIFSTFTSLQRSSVKVRQDKSKFSSKKEACEEKSTGARNDYILALAAANAHQDRYFNVDLDECLRTLEGDVYDKLKEYLTVLGRTELLTCSAAQNSFTKIRDQAQMLSRDYNVMCCVQYYPVLKQHIRYPFDPCDGDNCSKITCEHGAATLLSREAKKWATKIGKEVKIIRENQRKIIWLQQLKDGGHKNDPDDQNGPDLDTKIEEARDNIRRAETEKVKAEGCIECLRDGDVNVDEWMQDIENLTTTLDIPRSASATSIKTDISGDHQQQLPSQQQEAFYDSDANDASSEIIRNNDMTAQRDSDSQRDRDEDIESQIEMERKRIEALSATWDDPTNVDWGDTVEDSSDRPMTSPPPSDLNQIGKRDSWSGEQSVTDTNITKCVALYTYAAQNPDELSIVENEHLDLIGEGDGDGWVRARNYKGEEGYVPQNYVEQEGSSAGAGYPLQPQISFSSVDYHVQDTNNAFPSEGNNQGMQNANEGEEESEVPITTTTTTTNGITNGYLDSEDHYNQNLPAEEIPVVATTTVSSGGTTPFINELQGEETEGEFCRGLYDYEATAPEELSFYEGQIIRILRRIVHDEDDGWWEGEYDGMTGLFPSIVVEECRWDGEPLSPEGSNCIRIMIDEDDEYEEDEEISDSGIQPPCYTPPEVPCNLMPPQKVIITQPTPETEQPVSAVKPKSAASYSYDKPHFEMELNSDQQQKYQTQFGENGEPIIVIDEIPDVTITEPELEEEEDAEHLKESEKQEGGGDSSLDIAQIVITAATPMTEEAKNFPDSDRESDVGRKEAEEAETAEASPAEDEVTQEIPDDDQEITTQQAEEIVEQSFANFADFPSEKEQGDDEVKDECDIVAEKSPAEEVVPEVPVVMPTFEKAPVPKSVSQSQAASVESKEEEEEESDEEEQVPTPPLMFAKVVAPALIQKQTAQPATSTIEPKKASLDIEDKDRRSRISLGESNESPVTPEEIDLAKLETLKESDA